MIEIQDLKDLNYQQIVDLLLQQPKQAFEIYVPKQTSLFNSERFAISMDYAYLAYAGQVLKVISEEFSYAEVPPDSHESILYEIKPTDINLLAEELLNLSYGYVNDSPDEEFIYAELVEEFLGQVESAEIIPACAYFIEAHKEFAEEEDEEEQDDDEEEEVG